MKLILVVSAAFVAVTSAMYQPGDMVVDLTPSNFNKEVLQSDDLWIVEFYAPWCGHCQALAPEYKKAARALRGVVKLGGVNADEHKSLGGQYGVQGFPTIKIFGLDKHKAKDYNGARTAQAIIDNAMSELRALVNARMSGKKSSSGGGGGSRPGGGGGGGSTHDVVELTDSNFDELVMQSDDMWLVEFFAPWCGHCKNLAPEWAKAATELKGKVKVGAVDATVHSVVSNRYGVRGYPTIKYFPAGSKSEPEDYDGGRVSADIVAWALDKAAENIPPPEVIQLTDESVMKEACEDKQLCVIAFLPHILDCQSACRNGFLEVLSKMADHYKKRMWGWTWAEAGTQPDVEDALGIGGFGYPAMAAMNARKMKYAPFKGSFGETGINEFLRDLAFGRGSTAPVKNAQIPSIQQVEPWDGKDGEMPIEEDIDLSDVDLDDLDDLDKDEL